MNKKVSFFGEWVHPGESANFALPMPEQYSCAPLYMPIKVIHGKKPGPRLLVFSVLRGDELNGLEICNRLIENMSGEKIAGTLIAIPVVNIYGMIHYPQSLPKGKLLANCFPGKEEGSYGERIAHLFTQEILKSSDYCIELQTGGLNHDILPQVYCNFENKQGRQLAKLFDAPVVTNVSIEGNSLRQTTEELDIPLLVYQAGEAMRFNEGAILSGVKGVENVMRSLDMLVKEPEKEVAPIFSRDEEWLLAHKGGILNPKVTLGQTVEKGELIGVISDPFGSDLKESVYAMEKGLVVGINTSPLIHEGMAIFKMASFLDYDRAENVIEQWDKMQSEAQQTDS